MRVREERVEVGELVRQAAAEPAENEDAVVAGHGRRLVHLEGKQALLKIRRVLVVPRVDESRALRIVEGVGVGRYGVKVTDDEVGDEALVELIEALCPAVRYNLLARRLPVGEDVGRQRVVERDNGLGRVGHGARHGAPRCHPRRSAGAE